MPNFSSRIRSIIETFAWQLLILGAFGVLSSVFFLQPALRDYIDMIIVGLFLSCLIGWIHQRMQQPYQKKYSNEGEATETIADWLDSLPFGASVSVVGVATTSVFWLFDAYVEFMNKGGDLYVLMLDPKARDIIKMLSRNEPDFLEAVVIKLRTEGLEKIKGRIDEATFSKTRDLLQSAIETPDAEERYVCVIKSCALLWMHARDLALRKTRMDRLDLRVYYEQPFLKVWITALPAKCFQGTYISHFKVGRDNPIWVYDGRREQDALVITEIIDRVSHLRKREDTRIITRIEDM